MLAQATTQGRIRCIGHRRVGEPLVTMHALHRPVQNYANDAARPGHFPAALRPAGTLLDFPEGSDRPLGTRTDQNRRQTHAYGRHFPEPAAQPEGA